MGWRQAAALLLVLVAAACRASTSAQSVGDEPRTVVIGVGDNAAALVDAAPPGTRFEFAPGTHRGVAVVARRGDTFAGQNGAVLSGAVVLSEFTGEGDAWTAAAPAFGQPVGECRVERPACGFPEELFLDGQPLRRVASRADVQPGTWMADAASRRVVMGDSPIGRQVELSVVTSAIQGTAPDVTVSNLHAERYANPAGRGVIHMEPGAARWRVESCVVRQSHGVGVVLRDGSTLDGCRLEGNGQQGAGAQGTGITIRGNTITANNRAGFSPGWSAGGAKFALTRGLRVVGNVVSANDGAGLWTDIECVDTTYEDNVVQDNTGAGIHHEISGAAVIARNRVTGNGHGATGWVWGAGILIANSNDVAVRDNVVERNRHAIIGVDQERGAGERGPRLLARLEVTGNLIRDSGQTGVGQDHGDATVYGRGHRFDGNVYEGAVSWAWLDAELTWEQWRAVGHDPSGTFRPST